MLLKENTIFANRYQLERLLGRGGFSEVWLAKDSYTKLDIAIKVYAPGQGMDTDGLADFSAELAGVFNLSHSNLLKPTHVDAWEGMPYLIMPFCSRGSITKLVGKMKEEDVWKLIHDVASGLAYLHKNDIVHQDIKPDNILIDEAGNYVITDFGISAKARSTLRKSVIGGSVSGGTMAYMGPERFSKQPAPTKASDIWSFGAMVYELITGNVPFGEMGGGMQKGGAEIPEITEPISDELRKTIEGMLALETWDRPTAEQLSKGKEVSRSSSSNRETMSEDVKPKSSRSTQRFVQPQVESTSDVQQERTPAHKKGSWLWLPYVTMLFMAPFLYRDIISVISLFNGGVVWWAALLVCFQAIVSISTFSLLFWLVSVRDEKVRHWVSGLLSSYFVAEIATVIAWRSDYFIITIIGFLCLVLWIVFQRKLAGIERRDSGRKWFFIVLSIFYLIILAGLFSGIGSKNDMLSQEEITAHIKSGDISASVSIGDKDGIIYAGDSVLVTVYLSGVDKRCCDVVFYSVVGNKEKMWGRDASGKWENTRHMDVSKSLSPALGQSDSYSFKEVFDGTFTVTVAAMLNGVEYTLFNKAYGTKERYAAVDLGLSIQWATFNIGAQNPWEMGEYFAWGEIEPKYEYTWSSYLWKSRKGKKTKGNQYIPLIQNGICGSENDVATVKWGNDWRLPSRAELKELLSKCKWEWGEWNGVSGAKVTGSNGNWIFLPAGGYIQGTSVTQKNQYGYYPSGWLWEDDGPLCIWCTSGA